MLPWTARLECLYRPLMCFSFMLSKKVLICRAPQPRSDCAAAGETLRILTWPAPGAFTFWAMRSKSAADGYGSRSNSACSVAKTCGGDGEAGRGRGRRRVASGLAAARRPARACGAPPRARVARAHLVRLVREPQARRGREQARRLALAQVGDTPLARLGVQQRDARGGRVDAHGDAVGYGAARYRRGRPRRYKSTGCALPGS